MARLVMCTAGVLAVLLRSCSETLSIQPSAERTEIIGRDPTIDAIPSACGRQSAPKLPCLSKGRKTTFADRPIELYLRGGRAEDHSEDGEGAGEGASDNLPVATRFADPKAGFEGVQKNQELLENRMLKEQQEAEARRAQEEQRRQMVDAILDKGARSRLYTIAAVDPKGMRQLEDQLIDAARTGQILEQVTEAEMIKMLATRAKQKKQRASKVRFSRRGSLLDTIGADPEYAAKFGINITGWDAPLDEESSTDSIWDKITDNGDARGGGVDDAGASDDGGDGDDGDDDDL